MSHDSLETIRREAAASQERADKLRAQKRRSWALLYLLVILVAVAVIAIVLLMAIGTWKPFK